MMTSPELWARLDALTLDDPSAELGFSGRLANENGWTPAYACRVVGEYRRFLYLSQVGKGMITPPDAVDRAWHLHLTYTRHYWDTLCRDTLGRPLHHEPTRGGAAEDARHRQCYERAIALYRAEFGTSPPPDIWPHAAMQAGEALRHQATRRQRTRPVRHLGRAARLALIAPALLVGLASVALAASDEFPEFIGTLLILAVVIIAVVTLVTLVTGRFNHRNARRRHSDGSGGSCGSGGGSNCSSGDGGGSSGCGGGGD